MRKFFMALILSILAGAAAAREEIAEVPVSIVQITADNIQPLNDLIDLANVTPGIHQVNIAAGENGNTTLRGSLHTLEGGRVIINGQCPGRCTFMPQESSSEERFLRLRGDSMAALRNIEVSGFESSGNGGAILAGDQAVLYIEDSLFSLNHAGGNGGAIHIAGGAFASIRYTGFSFNGAFYGDHISINSNPGGNAYAFEGLGNFYYGGEGITVLENPLGALRWQSDSLFQDGGVNSTGSAWLSNMIFQGNFPSSEQMQSKPGNKPQAQCNDFGTGSFASMGYNIASDNSCSLDQETDLPSTDALISLTDDGIPMPMPGSPAIDSGPSGVMVVDDNPLAFLPCGYKDHAGTARPQDANGDGVFECDRGAIEVPGAGEIVPGHSAVFFNPDRNGEGSYVEILPDGRAVVYTFTYNTDGTGPAWFLGVGGTNGNSIIIDDLYRPIGASFGDDFDANDVEFTPAGSMSMVFPDCESAAPGGNVAFTGQKVLGYEGLITRSTRLGHITGCGSETPSVNAGLSGSFYDASRNGEGLIIEWLTNGDVLAVFFTYDTEGNQFWVFGQAAATGKSVTMNVIYPDAFTPWGREYDAADVNLGNWGTFTITWTDCNTLVFEYASTVAGFGTGTRNYTRLSTLAGTECPAFP